MIYTTKKSDSTARSFPFAWTTICARGCASTRSRRLPGAVPDANASIVQLYDYASAIRVFSIVMGQRSRHPHSEEYPYQLTHCGSQMRGLRGGLRQGEKCVVERSDALFCKGWCGHIYGSNAGHCAALSSPISRLNPGLIRKI